MQQAAQPRNRTADTSTARVLGFTNRMTSRGIPKVNPASNTTPSEMIGTADIDVFSMGVLSQNSTQDQYGSRGRSASGTQGLAN